MRLDELIRERCEDREPPPTGILNKPALEDRPCPTPVVMTPSQIHDGECHDQTRGAGGPQAHGIYLVLRGCQA